MTYSDRVFAEGKAEGRAEGQREMLLRLLALKFGALDEAVKARVRGAAPAEIDRWGELILTAATLESVFES